MLRNLLLTIILILPSTGWAAVQYPYSAVCEIAVEENGGYNGGSATLIAVSDDQALLLTCWHVVVKADNVVHIHWSATGEVSKGRVLKVDSEQDIAMVICPRPQGLRPVPVTLPDKQTSGTLTNVGFPGLSGYPEWQQGTIKSLDNQRLYYTCRPVPGMSGGCTFDQWGNQVGVITHYQVDGGISASGVDMITFVGQFVPSSVGVSWDVPVAQTEVPIADVVVHKKNEAPQEEYVDFEDYVWLNHVSPLAPIPTSPLIGHLPPPTPIVEPTVAPEPPVVEKAAPQKRKNYRSPPKRKRLFRRRR